MPKKKYLVTLNDDDREQLEHLRHRPTVCLEVMSLMTSSCG